MGRKRWKHPVIENLEILWSCLQSLWEVSIFYR